MNKTVFKNLLFSIIALVLLYLGAEILLCLIGFHYYPVDLGFTVSERYKVFSRQKEYYQTREDKLSLFANQRFPVKKDKDEMRIFILGGSSVNNLGSMDALKQNIENDLVRGKKVRMVNMGGNSYGTSRLLLVMQEVLEYAPDLVILYSGHNEFEEEFMKKTFFKVNLFTKVNNRLLLWSRNYQFLSMLYNKAARLLLPSHKEKQGPFFPTRPCVQWDITFDKHLIYEKYQRNVSVMIEMAKMHNIPMIISTVAYNRMTPPFKPQENNYYMRCRDLLSKGDFVKARACFDNELDLDLQPHRASKTSNEIIEQLATTYRVPLADVDAKIIEAAEYGIPGFDLFDNHCHLNVRGNEILQRVLYETIKDSGVLAQ